MRDATTKDHSVFWKSFSEKHGNPYLLESGLEALRCLLVYPSSSDPTWPCDYPIALGLFASLLRMNGAQVRILACGPHHWPPADLGPFDVAFLYPMATRLPESLDLAALLKRYLPSSLLCLVNSEQHQHELLLGTPGARTLATDLLTRHLFIDFALLGEAEHSILALAREVISPKKEFEGVPGLLYRRDGRISLSTAPPIRNDFTFLPYPSRDYLELTRSPSGMNTASVRIQSSRGCVSRCLYCVESSTNRPPGSGRRVWAGRSIPDFVDEIELLHRSYGVHYFNVIDSSFEDPGEMGRTRLEDFCAEVSQRSLALSFKIHLRMETLAELSEASLDRLKAAGIDVIIAGAESGLDLELQKYRKFTTAELNVRTLQRMRLRDDFFLFLGHIMFSPFLRLEDLGPKHAFLASRGRGWDYMNLSSNLIVHWGTAMHRDLAAANLLIAHDRPLPTLAYRYEDPRVGWVAEMIGNLKSSHPQLLTQNEFFYDALNIRARFLNQANRHLQVAREEYRRFNERLEADLAATATVYTGYFGALLSLARDGASVEAALQLAGQTFAAVSRTVAGRTGHLITEFLGELNAKGLDTGRLYLKSWISPTNRLQNLAHGRFHETLADTRHSQES